MAINMTSKGHMRMSTGIGNSSQVDGYEAALEAASTVQEQLGADTPDFVLVFSTIGYEQGCSRFKTDYF